MAQEWQMIDTFWNGERDKLNNIDKNHLIENNALMSFLNASEAWLETAEQTWKTTSNITTANLFLNELLVGNFQSKNSKNLET